MKLLDIIGSIRFYYMTFSHFAYTVYSFSRIT